MASTSRPTPDIRERLASPRALLVLLVVLLAGLALPRSLHREAEQVFAPQASRDLRLALPRLVPAAASRLHLQVGSGTPGTALAATAEMPGFVLPAASALDVLRRAQGRRAPALPAPSSRAPPLG
jgi:hypothetical protein